MTNAAPLNRLIPFGLLAVLIFAAACETEQTPAPTTPTPVASATPSPTAPPTSIIASATPTSEPTPRLRSIGRPHPIHTPAGPPTSTPTPLPPGTVLLSPIQDGQTLTFDTLPEPTPLDVYALARQFIPDADLSPSSFRPIAVGDARSFYVYSLRDSSRVELEARLCASTKHLDFYLDENLGLTCAVFTDALTRRIEERVRPSIIANFAGDTTAAEELRIAIVHADLPGFGGYFDASDLYPTGINPYASGRHTLYLNAAGDSLGNPRDVAYASLVAHELQHAIHQLSDPDESTWVNEGLSVLAEGLVSTVARANYFLNSCPPTQLNAWPSTPGAASCNYSAAGLFMRYLRDSYPSPDDTLRMLVAEPANGLRGIESYLSTIDADVDVLELMADWGVANYLDGRSTFDSYPNLEAQAVERSQLDRHDFLSKFFSQFAAEYVALPLETGSYIIDFSGDTTTPILDLPGRTGGSFWHAGSEDSAAYSLTREFDLRPAISADDATLTLLLRYDTEENWDYLYATVSTDGGQTWQVLRSASMTDTSEVAFGSAMFDTGFTGISGNTTQAQWILEELDLSEYVGQQILFRLLYLTDQSISLDGVSLAGAWLPAADYGWAAINHPVPIPLASATTNDQPDGGWTPEGFFFSNNLVQQKYALRLMTVDENGTAFITITPIAEHSRVVFNFDNSEGSLAHAALMVMPLAPQTRQPADATITIRPADET